MKTSYRSLLLVTTIIMLVQNSHSIPKRKVTVKHFDKTSPKFPKLTEFFKSKSDIKRRYKLSQCDVEVRTDECTFRVNPRKKHCLLVRNVVSEIMPEYKPVFIKTELSSFSITDITSLFINTCGRKITFKIHKDEMFVLIPTDFEMSSVEAGINIPIPLGDFQLFGAGTWSHDGFKFKVKFNKENFGLYNVKGYSEIDYLSIKRISEIFNVNVLPRDPISILLHKINMDNLLIRDCKVYANIQTGKGKYEIAFSGEADHDFYGGHIRVFITKDGRFKNLAVLLELQDYSPVTFLKKLYGNDISKVNILRDRNQTIALYISSNPTANFSNIYTSHGSSRWIHRDSIFDSGAYLLVTLPFPKRKAMDMKIQLLSDGLFFGIPESEKLSGDLILGAISPEKIIHIGAVKTDDSKNVSKYSKLEILKFRYFLCNDTYLAAVESHLSEQEELEDMMPVGRPDLLTDGNRNYYNTFIGLDTLDNFFKKKEFSREEIKRQAEKKNPDDGFVTLKAKLPNFENLDPLKMAESVGLL